MELRVCKFTIFFIGAMLLASTLQVKNNGDHRSIKGDQSSLLTYRMYKPTNLKA